NGPAFRARPKSWESTGCQWPFASARQNKSTPALSASGKGEIPLIRCSSRPTKLWLVPAPLAWMDNATTSVAKRTPCPGLALTIFATSSGVRTAPRAALGFDEAPLGDRRRYLGLLLFYWVT